VLRIQSLDYLKLYAELAAWISGQGPVLLSELASLTTPRPATPRAPVLNNVATNQTDPSSPLNCQLLPPTPTTTRDVSSPDQTTPTTEPVPPHSSHVPSFDTNHSNDLRTGFSIKLLRPRPTKCIVALSRIENHVYLAIDLPSQSLWNAIQVPSTKSVTSDDSSSISEGVEPLLLDIITRGATTRKQCDRVCGQCEKRMGQRIGPPSLLDFHSPSNVIRPTSGTVQVHFTFCCYSRHHQREDERYVYVAQ